MTAPILTVLIVTGGRDPLPALESSIASNRRDDVEWLVVDNSAPPLDPIEDVQGTPVRWLTAPAGDGHAALCSPLRRPAHQGLTHHDSNPVRHNHLG